MKEPLLKIGAAYIRVSDERQDEYSPDSQLKKIREYAAKEGYQIPDDYVFYDDGISGKSTRKRDEFNQMIAIAKEKDHPFDKIYVWKFSRFARNQEESLVYKNLLRKKDVAVVSVSEPLPEGPYGALIERIIEWMDEFYLINLGAEVKRGMAEKASRGEPLCAPPFGYVMRDGQYFPDEESGAADVVREIFRRYADGEGMREIAVALGDRGVKTKGGNKPDKRWISYTLNNPCFIGKIRWSTDGTRAVTRLKYDNDSIMTVQGSHEPLIDTELWERVQARLAQQKKTYPAYARQDQSVGYMLKGLVRCSACGGALTRTGYKSGKNKARCLQCCAYNVGSCHVSHSITVPRIEAAVIDGLRQAVGSQTFAVTPRKPHQTERKGIDYDKLIALEERRLDRAKDAYLAGVDTIEQYAAIKAEITDKIAELNAMRDRDNAPQSLNKAAYAAKVAGVLEIITTDGIAPEAKNEALRTVVEKIVYNKPEERVEIYFWGD
ncbi:MAG: recombinase family protein [Clostridia bacterium]|nr:recombinase family protein [Clostridia bacterium]MBP3667881.1 recombinase family protein [Clostridia bacterium]